jgi:hypothetical protein
MILPQFTEEKSLDRIHRCVNMELPMAAMKNENEDGGECGLVGGLPREVERSFRRKGP